MIDLKGIIKRNLLLKMTSLNAVVIIIRLVVSLFIQRLLAVTLGEAGIAKIGQLRNLMQILTSTASLGTLLSICIDTNGNSRNNTPKMLRRRMQR